MSAIYTAIQSAAFIGVLMITPAFAQNMQSIEVLSDQCGNNPDAAARSLACSQMIAHPGASTDNVAAALWTRAYVRCRDGSASEAEIMSDLMTSARIDPAGWKRQYQSSYAGPDAGLYPIAYDTLLPWVKSTCL